MNVAMNALETNGVNTTYYLDHVSDGDLLAGTRRLVGRSNQVLAALLAHLAEVEARGIHRDRACASLYTYCIYELRMSEDAAFRRARAAKIARQFPVLFEQVAAGEIHLTGLLMLGPHLTEANHVEVLARAKHRTKKEIERLVRMLDPLPDVRAGVEPLGPAPRVMPATSTWRQMVDAVAPEVRELPPGDRPKDWAWSDAGDDDAANDGAPDDEGANDDARIPEAPGGADAAPALTPQRYKVQFTATQEYVDLLETAKELLAHAGTSHSIEEVHLRAMRALVTELKKRKTGATNRPPADEARSPSRPETRKAPRQRGADLPAKPRQRGAKVPVKPRQRGRHVPREVRRAVWERDGQRCTYVDAGGQRCRETGGLELDHVHPHARGGSASVENLRLRCHAHNALAAEREFGRAFMAQKRRAATSEVRPP